MVASTGTFRTSWLYAGASSTCARRTVCTCRERGVFPCCSCGFHGSGSLTVGNDEAESTRDTRVGRVDLGQQALRLVLDVDYVTKKIENSEVAEEG